jgi:hypothetical protein
MSVHPPVTPSLAQEESRRSSDTVSGPLDRHVALYSHADFLAR